MKTKTVEQKLNEFQEVAKPLFDWLLDNASPHDVVIIDMYNARFLEGAYSVPSELTIKEREE